MNTKEQILCLNTIWRTLVRNWFKLKFEPEIQALDQWIKKDAVCLDIGAGYGRYAYALSQLVRDSGQVHCFEPLDYNLTVLRAIVKFHRLKNVTVIPKALSNQSGTQGFALPIKKSALAFTNAYSLAHLATDSESESIKKMVSVTTIDQYALEHKLNRIDFIKCDVEGAELLVFNGGKNILQYYKPVILCEVYETWLRRFGYKREDVFRFFAELNYQAFILNGKALNKVDRLKEDRNYFFIPRPHSSV